MRYIKNLGIFVFFLSLGLGGDRIAVATKVIGSVHYIRGKGESTILKKGHIFESGDILKTDKDSFAALIFIDDKSALKVKENTEIIISGKRSAKAIAKEINLDGISLPSLFLKFKLIVQYSLGINCSISCSLSEISFKATD